MFKSKNSILYLTLALIIVLIALYYWKQKTTENLSLPQSDIHWKTVSGETEFRNKKYETNQIENTNMNYSKIPLQSDTAYITGMNKYLWDKQKQGTCATCK